MMATVVALIVTGMAALGAAVGMLLIRGGWEAGAAGLGLLAVPAFLVILAALGAEGDGLSRPR
jgi:hypothetical protein